MKKIFLTFVSILCIQQVASAAGYELGFVVGTGRSGSSIYTKACNVAGLALTEDVAEYTKPCTKRSNPWGGYEAANVGRHSSQTAMREGQKVFNATKSDILGRDKEIDGLIKHLTLYFQKDTKIVIKNTRAAIMLPTWQAAFDGLAASGIPIDVRYLVVLRNPIDMATSVATRQKSPAAFQPALDTWEISMNGVLTGTTGKTRLFVKFEELINTPEATIAKLAAFFGTASDTVPDPATVTDFTTRFLSTDYVRAITPFETVTDPRLSASQIALVQALDVLYQHQ